MAVSLLRKKILKKHVKKFMRAQSDRKVSIKTDNLRQKTLQQMYKILTNRQAARGLLTLGDYFQ